MAACVPPLWISWNCCERVAPGRGAAAKNRAAPSISKPRQPAAFPRSTSWASLPISQGRRWQRLPVDTRAERAVRCIGKRRWTSVPATGANWGWRDTIDRYSFDSDHRCRLRHRRRHGARIGRPGAQILLHTKSNRAGLEKSPPTWRHKRQAHRPGAWAILRIAPTGADLVKTAVESLRRPRYRWSAMPAFRCARSSARSTRDELDHAHAVIAGGFFALTSAALPHLKAAGRQRPRGRHLDP